MFRGKIIRIVCSNSDCSKCFRRRGHEVKIALYSRCRLAIGDVGNVRLWNVDALIVDDVGMYRKLVMRRIHWIWWINDYMLVEPDVVDISSPCGCFKIIVSEWWSCRLETNFEAGSSEWRRSHLPSCRRVEQSCFLCFWKEEIVPMDGCWKWRGHWIQGRALIGMTVSRTLAKREILLINERRKQWCVPGS